MPIDMITENISSLTTSPRISFSNDLHQKTDAANNEDYSYCSDSSMVDSSSDFDFCISNTDAETSSADELFSDGLIRPLQLQEKFVNSKSFSIARPQSQACLPPLPPPPTSTNESSKQEKSKEIESTNAEAENKHQSRSFWHIKRSSSLHSDSSHKMSSFWSLPLLSRSNSTGSITKASKEGHKQNANSKQHKRFTASSSSSGASFYTYPSTQKPPVRRSYGGSHSNGGVRISPVLNVPPPCNIKGTANLFGFGSLFRNGKDNKNKK